MRQLGDFGYTPRYGLDINDRGQVARYTSTATFREALATVWNHGRPTLIDARPAGSYRFSTAQANNMGTWSAAPTEAEITPSPGWHDRTTRTAVLPTQATRIHNRNTCQKTRDLKRVNVTLAPSFNIDHCPHRTAAHYPTNRDSFDTSERKLLMDLKDLIQAFVGLSEAKRPIRLRLSQEKQVLDDVLLVKRVVGNETLCGGLEYRLLCVSTRADLPLKEFIALPVELQFVTDRGDMRAVCGIVAQVAAGQSDGGLATYELVVRDALALMEYRTNTRVFRNQNELDITDVILREWRRHNPVLAKAFDVDWSHATILPPSAPGDQTVLAKSADHQLKSGMFKGVFRQTGYEHQSSYKNPRAIASTLYSIVRIAQKATWNCEKG